MRRLSHEYVEDIFLKNNCVLLDIYKNSKQKLKYKCICGNISEIRYNDFQQNHRCMKCSGSKKYTNEYVTKYFEKYNYKLLTNYENNKQKLQYICDNGHISNITFNSFLNGKRCKKCYIITNIGENHPRWIKNRTHIKNIQDLHKLSNSYKRKYRKKYNIIDKNIHIDHIFPIKAFVEHGIYNLDVINNESNLRAISKHENLVKNSKYNKNNFIKYLTEKGEIKWQDLKEEHSKKN